MRRTLLISTLLIVVAVFCCTGEPQHVDPLLLRIRERIEELRPAVEAELSGAIGPIRVVLSTREELAEILRASASLSRAACATAGAVRSSRRTAGRVREAPPGGFSGRSSAARCAFTSVPRITTSTSE